MRDHAKLQCQKKSDQLTVAIPPDFTDKNPWICPTFRKSGGYEMFKTIERITSDPKICNGKPCVKGTRIPVHIVLDLLAAGESFEGIITAYPNLTDKDIRACLSYAAILADDEAGITT